MNQYLGRVLKSANGLHLLWPCDVQASAIMLWASCFSTYQAFHASNGIPSAPHQAPWMDQAKCPFASSPSGIGVSAYSPSSLAATVPLLSLHKHHGPKSPHLKNPQPWAAHLQSAICLLRVPTVMNRITFSGRCAFRVLLLGCTSF